MNKLFTIIVLAGISGGLCYFLSQYEVSRIDGHVIISRRDGQANLMANDPLATATAPSTTAVIDNTVDLMPPPRLNQKTLRIATYNLDGFNSHKPSMPLVTRRLAILLAGFDIVAVQDIRESHLGSLHELVDVINSLGRKFDFAASPEVASGSISHYNAFLFDRASIELDRFKICAVANTDDAMRCRPLSAVFRARGPQASEAFTFVLVNINVDLDRASGGLNILDDVYRAVRAANPDEDDVILLGNFETDSRQPASLSMIPNVGWAVEGLVSTVRGDRLADNLVFDRQTTTEFTGRADVVDVVRSLNITSEEAARISGHLPVWAEFSVFEGGLVGHIAEKTTDRLAK